MRIATPEDFSTVKEMVMDFIKVSGYNDYADQDVLDALIFNMLAGPQNEKIIILTDGGFLAGRATQFPFGKHLIASEIAWWVNPDSRGNKEGTQLLEAFEFWAKEKAGCSLITMTSLSETIGEIYEKKGYKLYERAYMKVL